MALKIKVAFFLFLIAACNCVESKVEEVLTTPEETTDKSAPTETAATEDPATTAKPDPTDPPTPETDFCKENPCPSGIDCQNRFETFECKCLGGDHYDRQLNKCISAKVFPAKLMLKNFVPPVNFSDIQATSKEFNTAEKKIINELNDIYKGNPDYEGSRVQGFQATEKSRVWTRSQIVTALVEIIFDTSSTITLAEVQKKFNTATECTDCFLKDATYTATDLCEKNTCDSETSECESADGVYTCKCKETYIETSYSQRMCVACPSGEQAVSKNKCEPCLYGLLGTNCNEPWMLVTIVLGSVFGGLLLISIIIVPMMTMKSPKKKKEKSAKKNKDEANGKSFMSQPPVKPTMDSVPLTNQSRPPSVQGGSAIGPASFTNAGVPRIPRATTNNSWDSRSNMEMTPSSSRQNLVPVGRPMRPYEESDDMYGRPYQQTRPQSNPYIQNRPQSSPYAQNRPQVNPYVQSRPQTNPYAQSQGQNNYGYSDDEGRRFNY